MCSSVVGPRRLRVIFNPTAGSVGRRAKRLHDTLDLLRAAGVTLDLCPTQARGDARRLAAEATPEVCDAVVAAGGDGTINEVANGLIDGGHGLALGIIPLGTANVLALEMGLAVTPQAIANALLHGCSRPVPLAAVDGRAFLLMGGAGFDAFVVDHVNLRLKRHAGKLAYVWETLVQAVVYGFPRLRATIDGRTEEAGSIVVLRGRLYGGPFVAVPQGDLCDPALHVVLLRRGGTWNVLRYGLALVMGRLSRLRDVTILRTTGPVAIDGPRGAPFQADGDTFCRLPAVVTIGDARVDLLFPP